MVRDLNFKDFYVVLGDGVSSGQGVMGGADLILSVVSSNALLSL